MRSPVDRGWAHRFPALEAFIDARLNAQQILTHWPELLRLAASIKQGTVTASLMLRKLGSYPRQNRQVELQRDPMS